MSAPVLVAIDWGTTSFRAFALDAAGHVLERIEAPLGIMQIDKGRFEETLEQKLEEWGMAPDLPLVASGMITSRQGWIEVEYVPCPAGFAEIARGLVHHRTRAGRQIHFVPGLIDRQDAKRPDVMRGEETQILGAVGQNEGQTLALLPGTHSKWALVEKGVIRQFSTFMTGELFSVLRQHSILGRLMAETSPGAADEKEDQGFKEGVEAGLESRGGLLHQLFSARTLPLTGTLPARATAAYLSGLLIGAEIGGARHVLGETRAPISLIGSANLAGRYQQALAIAAMKAGIAEADAAAKGLFQIARARGIIAAQ